MLFNLFTPSYPVVDVNIPEGWWKSDSQLDIDFANGRSFNRKTAYKGRPDDLLTYTSPSPKMVYGDDGVLGYARHNLLTYSEQFDNAAWTKSASSISANAVAAPIGSLIADKIVEASDVNQGHLVTRNYSVVAGLEYTVSVYLKAAERTYAFVLLSGAFTSTAISVNLSTGAIADVVATSLASTTTDVGNGWYRVSLSLAAASTGTGSITVYTGVGTSWSQRQYDGDGVSGIYIWGSQFCRGRSALDYLATTSAAKYDLPIAHDPLTHAPLGVLIEEQRTNLLLRSEDCTTTWTDPIGPTTSTKVNIPSPFHDGIAFQITNTLNSGFSSGGLRQSVAVASSTQHFLSFYVEDNVGLITIALENGLAAYGASFNAQVDTATGVSSGSNAAQVTTVAVNGGWYVRANLGTSKSGGGTANIEIQMTMAGLGVPKIIAAIKFEAGAFATSYIQTGSAQVTRAADVPSIATSAFSYSATEGSIYYEANSQNLSSSFVYEISNGTTANRIVSVAGPVSQLYVAVTVAVVDIDAGTFAASAGTFGKAAQAFKANDFAVSLNGGVPGTDASGGMPSVDNLRLGSQVTGINFLNGHIKRLTYWNSRKSNPELQGLSA